MRKSSAATRRQSQITSPNQIAPAVESLEARQLLSSYTITNIGLGDANGLNDEGTVVGVAPGPNSTVENEDAFYWKPSNPSVVNDMTFGGDYGVATAINDDDDVVGYAGHETVSPLGQYAFQTNIDDHLKIGGSDFVFGDSPDSPTSSFSAVDDGSLGLSVGLNSTISTLGVFYNGTTFAAPGLPDAKNIIPNGIADYDPNLGTDAATVGASDNHAYFSTGNGTTYDLEDFLDENDDEISGDAIAISPNGDFVVGYSTSSAGTEDSTYPFIVQTDGNDAPQAALSFGDAGNSEIGLTESDEGSALAVNDSGVSVGSFNIGDSDVTKAFISNLGGSATFLQNLIPANSGWSLEAATGINSSGQICGYGEYEGAQHAFFLNPVTTGSVSGTVTGGKAGETVYLDANNDSQLDDGELSTTTASNGTYAFSSVPEGAYVVRQVLPSGFTQTSPSGGLGIHITVTAGGSLANENFTDTATVTGGSVSGTVTGGKAGETVYLDANNNSKLDSGEPSATTSSTGAYSFSGVPAGAYVIRQVLPAGYTQTSPSGGLGIHVTVTNGGKLTGENFADKAPVTGATISGTVSGGKAGETVYLDANNNSKLDSGELSTTTSSTGTYSFIGVPAGAYVIRQVLPTGYTQTAPAGGLGIHVTATNGANLSNENFTDKAPAAGAASIAGTVFVDANGDGKPDDGEVGLDDAVLYLDLGNSGNFVAGDPTVTTDDLGNYIFSGLAAGTYIVRVETPAGYSQTAPSGGLGQHIAVASTQKVTGVLFGEKKI